jgi:hypothetical protein
MPMRIKIPNRAANYIIALANEQPEGPTDLQTRLLQLRGFDRILVTDSQDMVDELRDTMAQMVADSIERRSNGDPTAKDDASAASKVINNIDQAESRLVQPRGNGMPKSDYFELYDNGNDLDTEKKQTFAAAIQVARGKKWRTAKWQITDDSGNVLRRHDEQQEIDYRASLPEPAPKPAKKAASAKADA